MAKIVLADGRPCTVVSTRCRWLACLRPGFHTIRSAAGASGCSSRTDTHRSCVRWTDYGCPPVDERHTVWLEDIHQATTSPRFAWRLRRASGGRMRCTCGCGQLFPRWLIYEWQQRTDTTRECAETIERGEE